MLNSSHSYNYRVLKLLGEGGFGKVYQCIDLRTNEECAVKMVPRGEVAKGIVREVLCHRQLRHPNIVGFKEVFLTSSHVCIAMELAVQGDMYDFLQQKMKKNSENLARYFFQQLVVGLRYCHERGVCVRDIKLENTLLGGRPDVPLVKICDFGYAKQEFSDSVCHSQVGTILYVAPEVITCDQYDGKIADVWSAGVLLYTLLTGCYPFCDPAHPKSEQHTMRRILSVQWKIPSSVSISKSCQDLLERLFVADPKERITLPEVMQHPWFTTNFAAELNSVGYQQTAYAASPQSEQEIREVLYHATKLPGMPRKRGSLVNIQMDQREGVPAAVY